MDSDVSRIPLDAYAVSCIKQHARTLCRKEGFVPEDLQDLEQELTIHLWEQLGKFDPSRGKLTTFVDRVVRNKAADLLEARQAACRDCRLDLGSLYGSATEEENEEATVADVADVDALRHQLGLSHHPFDRDLQLRVDLVRALAKLTPEQLDLCRRLLEGSNLSRIASELGVPRGTLYESVYRIRAIFEQAGLRAHLGENSRHSGPRSRK